MTDTPRKRKTTDELLAEAEERTRQLKARKRREQARAREAKKAMERKLRARVLIEIASSAIKFYKTFGHEGNIKNFYNIVLNSPLGPDPKRRQEALAWLQKELNLPEPDKKDGSYNINKENTAPAAEPQQPAQ